MSTVAFDTLRAAERLKAAGFTEDQAKALVEAFAQALPLQDLVTREYLDARLQALEERLGGGIERVRSEPKGEIGGLDAKISGLEAKMEHMRADLVKWTAGLLIAQAGLIVAPIELLS